MIDVLERRIRKAYKPHECCYCGETIEKGETYDWSKQICDGTFYEWFSHMSCSRVASAVWDYADPDEGMTDQLFLDTCQEVCQTFICPDCPDFDMDYQGCRNDESFCIEKMDEFFKTNELYCAGREGYARLWKCRPKEEKK